MLVRQTKIDKLLATKKPHYYLHNYTHLQIQGFIEINTLKIVLIVSQGPYSTTNYDIVGFGLVEISTNPKPTIYRKLYEILGEQVTRFCRG